MEKKPEHEALLRYLHEKLAADLNPRERRLRGSEGLRRMADTAGSLVWQLRPGQIRVEILTRALLGGERTIVHALLPEQPFLVDSFRMTLARLGMREKLLLHPSLAIDREEDGSPSALGSSAGGREVYLYAEVASVDAARHSELASEVGGVLRQLQHVVADHGAMLETMRVHTEGIEAVDRRGRSHARELMDFLYWLAADNFVFLGYRRYALTRHDGDWKLRLESQSGLGLLRDAGSSRFGAERSGAEIPELIRSRADDELLVFFDKSNTTSIVHREGRLDTISIKIFDARGELCGFGKFIGLLTYQGVRSRPSDIPIIRHRRERVLGELAAERGSHTYKAAIEAFDSLPLEFLFAFHTSDITKAIRSILRAYEGRSIEIVAIPAPLARSFFVSVILPRALYRENLRSDLRALFIERYSVSYLDHRSSFVDDDCALIHFFCTTTDDIDREVLAALRRDVKRCTMRWEDRFEAALLARFPEDEAYRLAGEYESGFPQEYRVVTPPEEADLDLVHLERIRTGAVSVELTFGALDEGENGGGDSVCLKIYQRERPYLTDLLPLLDQFGLRAMDARLTEVCCRSSEPIWIGAFDVERQHDAGASLRDREKRLVEGMGSVLSGRADRDSLNSLIFGVGLDWREVDLLRAYFAYAAQIGFMVRLKSAAETLLRYPDATRALLALFAARFDPDLAGSREAAVNLALAALAAARERIPTADEDRILGVLAQLMQCTLRTSYYATDASQELIAFKLDSAKLPDAPHPRPWAEIFVHSVEMSGVHLRGGPIARGGIRWSDRNQDFRKEILGLMKTQMVKNALIVPVGAKGGFVLRQRFDDPVRTRREADRQYARFIRALLGLTDDVRDGAVVPPPRVVRHDGDDPYLVVAADKGTAHLSDTANAIAAELGFWLSDAFASGGSAGYDHKAQGITARGGWACVRRHFLERGIDIDTQSFSMAGIGDMSGDVFGNALVLARNARLLAAFNHQHVFLDPDPDSERAWAERKRLFEMPRSTWRDYERSAISPGGGVFDRSARAIPLAPEARRILGVSEEKLSGEQIVRAILRMPVDLLWNGGIGTYVKSRSESHTDAGDRANDSVRIDACDLRARVVAEGGNLGFTQLARVEYALAGGCINTDAVDNSGGVNLSDLEVNFKILLAPRLAQGRMERADRNALLRECAPHACAYVISHNDSQSHAVSLDRMRATESPERMNLAAHFLGQRAGLDPKLECLPSTEELRSRARPGRAQSYTRPELALLLGYTKLFCKRELSASPLVDHASFEPVLASYFPERLREAFAPDVRAHALRREIAASVLTNRVIDRAGVTLLPELSRTQGAAVPEILAAYYTVDHLLEADSLRWAIERQDVREEVRLLASRRLESAVRSGTRVWLGLEPSAVLEPAELASWRVRVNTLRDLMRADAGDPDLARVAPRAQALVARGLDEKLAHEIERLPFAMRALGAISIALARDLELPRVIRMHTGVGRVTRISWLLDRIEDLERRSGWERIAVETLFLELLAAQRSITARMLEGGAETDAIDAFCREHAHTLDAIHESAREIDAEEVRALPPLTVVAQMIRRLE